MLLLPPVERLPLQEESALQYVLRREAYIGQRDVGEGGAHVGNILRTLLADCDIRLLRLKTGLPHFCTLLDRLPARSLEVDLVARGHRLHFNGERSAQIPAQQTI